MDPYLSRITFFLFLITIFDIYLIFLPVLRWKLARFSIGSHVLKDLFLKYLKKPHNYWCMYCKMQVYLVKES